ncbi:MAG: Crp/Fnr family transcriptional regulator [Paracoccaceae bacterium]
MTEVLGKLDRDIRRTMVARCPAFSSLSASEKAEIATALTPSACAAEAVLFQRGDPGEQLYLIVTGQVHVALHGRSGTTRLLRVLKSGDVFGEIALLGNGERSATAIAHTPCRFLTLGRVPFLTMLGRSRACVEAMTTLATERVRNMSDLGEHALYAAKPRVASAVLKLVEQHGRRVDEDVTIDIRLTDNTLAQLAQVSRQTANAYLRELHRSGVIQRRSRGLLVRDQSRLRALAEEDA